MLRSTVRPVAAWLTLAVLLAVECAGGTGLSTAKNPARGADGICDRTAQVREALQARLVETECGAVTDADLATLTDTLSLDRAGISTLLPGDFSGLTSLRGLRLGRNALRDLPADVFEDLASLTSLELTANALRTLPAGVFDNLVNLEILDVEFNQLETLPAGVFDGLELRFLGLEGNRLRSLPLGVFDGLTGSLGLDLSHNGMETVTPGVFAHLGDLTFLDLSENELRTLPAGVLAGLTSLDTLWLDRNPGAPFTFRMTVDQVPGASRVVVTVPEGAPFDMTTTIGATGGSLAGGVSQVSVLVGRTRSEEIEVVPLAGTTITLGAAPPVPTEPPDPRSNTAPFYGVQSAVGGPVVFEAMGKNSAPWAIGSLRDRQLQVGDGGKVMDVTGAFFDPDGDPLVFEAGSSAPAVASVAMSGSTLTLTSVTAGAATITVTARDEGHSNHSAAQRFDVMVAGGGSTGGSGTGGSTGGSGTGGSTGGSGTGGSSTGGSGGGGGGGSSGNRPPVVTEDIGARELEVGDSVQVDASEHFRDPDRRRMEFEAESTNPSVAMVEVEGSVVTIGGVGHGVAEVMVTATDHRRAQATQDFTVSVGYEVSFVEFAVSVPEGATARLAVTINRPREVATPLDYTVGVDADDTTADADGVDHDGTQGTVILGPGEREGVIEITVYQDSDIEPPQETFVVMLAQPAAQADAYGLGRATTVVNIAEGVCDRTVQVRNALRRSLPCDAVSDAELTRVRTLALAEREIAALRPRDLSGLTALRTLELSGNRLVELPAGLFEDLAELEAVQLRNNPGTPFELRVRLERTDALPSARGPATVVARLLEGAPFPMTTSLSAVNGTSSVEEVAIPVGATQSAPFAVTAAGTVRVTLGPAPEIPNTRCGEFGDYLCYQGLATATDGTLVLFKDPPVVTGTAPLTELATDGDAARVELAGLFSASDGGALTYTARSGDPALATVTVDGTVLTISSNEDGSEGIVTITVIATDADGLSVTLDLQATIEFMPRGFMRGWRRIWITDALRESEQADSD